jgi:hypothetical protein
MNTFTVFVRESDNTGTTYITCVDAESIDAAKSAALAECAEAWDYELYSLRVTGVAEGDVNILEWDDE